MKIKEPYSEREDAEWRSSTCKRECYTRICELAQTLVYVCVYNKKEGRRKGSITESISLQDNTHDEESTSSNMKSKKTER